MRVRTPKSIFAEGPRLVFVLMLALTACLPVRGRAAGPTAPADSSSLEATVRDLYKRGRAAQAEPLLQRALAEPALATRADSLRRARWLDLLVEAQWRIPHYTTAAESLAQLAVETRSRLDGDPSDALALALATQARVWRGTRSAAQAEARLRQALTMHERFMAAPDSFLADLLVSQGNMLRSMGRGEDAVAAHERALAIRREVYGTRHREVGRSLVNLALAYESAGHTHQRLEAEQEAIEIFEEAQPLDSLGIYYTCKNHAGALFTADRHIEAGPYVARILELRPRMAADGSHEEADVEETAGIYQLAMGDALSSERHFDRCGEIYGPMGRKLDQGGFARYQLNRSRTEWRLGRPDSALACVHRAEWTYRTFFDPNPTPPMGLGLAAALDRKGQVLAHLDRLSEAATAFEEAIRLNERFLTPGHPNLPRIETELAGIRLRQGLQDSATVSALRGASGLTAYVRWEFSRMTEDEALRYRGTGAAAALNVLLSVAATEPGSRWVPAIWDAVVEDAGLVAAEVTARRRLWSATRDSLLADWARELIVVRAHQGESQANRPGPASDSLTERARLLEERLATRSAGLRHDLSLHAISGAEVSGALPEHARLVHFVRFLWSGTRAPSEDRESFVASRDEPRIGGPASEWYGAFLVPAGGPPRFVPIGSARRIDAELGQWHRQLASGRRLDAQALRVGRALRRRLWDPLAVDARTCPLVFVVPAGPLAVLNFATLPGEDGVPLVESAPPIQLLDSPRQLLAPRRPAASGRALIVGGADYDASLPAGPPVPGALPAFRGRSSDCRAPATRTFEPLPASAEEASHVGRAWSRREGSIPDVRLGPLATELAVRREAGGCELIHIATHGYLVPDSCEATVRAGPLGVADLIGFAMPPGAGERMLHMGLVFAGANATGRSAGDDGWLTAADVAMLDLSGARLVTLSACESGRGDPVDAEGLIGLRWALMEAGAGATLTSCHRVSDEHAARWIDHFYSAWLGESLPLPAAAREASRRLRRELRARGQGERPGAWGAFLTAGDWH